MCTLYAMNATAATTATAPPTAPPMTPPLTPLDDDELVGVAVFVGGLGVRLGFDPVLMVFTAMTVAFWTFRPATPDNVCQTGKRLKRLCNL